MVKRRALVSGDMLVDSRQAFDPQTGQPVISFRFNSQGAGRFGDATRQNIGKRFAIVLDNKVVSAPVIQGAILGGSGQISGNFTPESANDLALLLRSGALPAPLKVEEQRTVGAELGADAVRSGAIALGIGAVAIFVFIILAYGLFGAFAAVALVVNILLIIALMSLTQATLTLPGIAGLILTLAVAVDANVLIYERMRDEARAGRSALIAADHGFRLALPSIMDANVTTMISALIMFQFGSGPVRGFGVDAVDRCLDLGLHRHPDHPGAGRLVVSRFPRQDPADLTEPMMRWPLTRLLPSETHFKFVRLAPFAAVLSVIALLASGISLATRGLNLGIDFRGGTLIEAVTPGPAPLGRLSLPVWSVRACRTRRSRASGPPTTRS